MEGGDWQDLRQGLGTDEVGVIEGPKLVGLEAKINEHNNTMLDVLYNRKIFGTVKPKKISKLLINPDEKGVFEFFLINMKRYVLLYNIYDDTKIVEQYCVLSILKEKPKNSEEKFKVYKINSIVDLDLSKRTTFKQNLEKMMLNKVGKKQRIYHIYCVKMVGGDADAELARTGASEDVTRNRESGYGSDISDGNAGDVTPGVAAPQSQAPHIRNPAITNSDEEEVYEDVATPVSTESTMPALRQVRRPLPRSAPELTGNPLYLSADGAADEADAADDMTGLYASIDEPARPPTGYQVPPLPPDAPVYVPVDPSEVPAAVPLYAQSGTMATGTPVAVEIERGVHGAVAINEQLYARGSDAPGSIVYNSFSDTTGIDSGEPRYANREAGYTVVNKGAAEKAKAMVANATFDTSQNKNSAAVKRTNKEEMTPAKSHALPTRKSVTDAIEAAGNVTKLEARRMLRKAGKRPGMYVLRRGIGAVVVVTAVNDNKEFIEFRVRRTGMNDDRSVTLFGTMSDINPTFDNAVDAVMFLHTPNSTSKTDQRITHLVAAAATI
jgi:hypothetical protein